MIPGWKLRLELEGKKAWSKPVIMESLSSRYGWTPDQIRNINMSDIRQYLEIIREQNLLEKRQALLDKKL